MPEETRRPTSHLDPRSPLVLDTRELGRRAGSMRRMTRSVPAPAHLGVDVLGVPEGTPLELDLRLESVVEGVLVTATVRTTVAGECVRCLDPVERPFETDLQELYAYPGEGHDGQRERGGDRDQDQLDELEELVLVAGLLDLEPVVRDAVVLALPLAPLCREDCPGLCPQCGARLESDPGHGHEELDPRWAALHRLRDAD